jgi:hypothetical protein
MCPPNSPPELPVAESERPPPDERILEKFARRRRRLIWMFAIGVAYLCAASVPMLILILESGGKDLWGLWMAIMAGWLIFGALASVFHVRNWRCPACDKFLADMVDPIYCGWCGGKIPEERRCRWWCESCGGMTKRGLSLRFCPKCGVQLQRVCDEE